jgi:hypothetical protein
MNSISHKKNVLYDFVILEKFQKSKDLLILGHPTHAGLKPKSKDLVILGHPTHAGLKPVLPPPHLGHVVQLNTV